ncbi:MAG: hypothetical protein MAG451_00833 [Anaerolineales bacterium]|nr:hypothetical protein [Anaerolineales bacterium]
MSQDQHQRVATGRPQTGGLLRQQERKDIELHQQPDSENIQEANLDQAKSNPRVPTVEAEVGYNNQEYEQIQCTQHRTLAKIGPEPVLEI